LLSLRYRGGRGGFSGGHLIVKVQEVSKRLAAEAGGPKESQRVRRLARGLPAKENLKTLETGPAFLPQKKLLQTFFLVF
jgi:hypothetical protein